MKTIRKALAILLAVALTMSLLSVHTLAAGTVSDVSEKFKCAEENDVMVVGDQDSFFVAIKQANKWTCWTAADVTKDTDTQNAIMEAVLGDDGNGNAKWEWEFHTFDPKTSGQPVNMFNDTGDPKDNQYNGKVTFTIGDDGQVTMTLDGDKYSHYFFGKCTMPSDPQSPVTDSAEVTIPVTKTVTADAGVQVPLLEAFTFQLKDASGTVVDEARITAVNGRGDYPGALKASFEEPGTYTLTVSEVDEAATGWSYDDAVYTVGVSVVAGAEGKLSATVTDITKSGATADDVVFTNTYASAPEESEKPTATAEINFSKAISADEGVNVPDGSFTFELRDTAGDLVKTSTVNTAGTQTAAGKIEMTYTTGGIYNYTLTEKKGEATGWTYDETSYKVMVVVPHNNGKVLGTAYVSFSDKDNKSVSAITFTNTYTSAPNPPADTSASLIISGEKKITTTDNSAAPSEKFNFVLSEGENVIANADCTGAGRFSFDPITYTEAGEHTYTVTETAGTATGWTYDSTVYTVKVSVAAGTDGKLSASVTSVEVGSEAVTNNAITFTNKYESGNSNPPADTSASLTISGEKKVTTTDNSTAPSEKFNFVLSEGTNVIANAECTGAGRFSFDPITYTVAGEHTYTLTETAGTATGWTYDSTVYTVKVSVTTGNDGKLSASVTSVEKGGEAVTNNAITFTNKYESGNSNPPADTSASLTISGEKKVTTTDNSAAPSEKFNFVLREGKNVIANADCTGAGRFSFDPITYTVADEHTYTLTETAGTATGWTYDSTVYTVKVSVTTGNDGKLSASVTSVKVGNEVVANSAITFTNTYVPTGGNTGNESGNTGGTGGTGGPGNSGGTGGGTGGGTVIAEPPVPLGPQPEIPEENTVIEDETVPLDAAPKTGDVSALWLAMSGLSGLGLAATTLLGRKKRDEA